MEAIQFHLKMAESSFRVPHSPFLRDEEKEGGAKRKRVPDNVTVTSPSQIPGRTSLSYGP